MRFSRSGKGVWKTMYFVRFHPIRDAADQWLSKTGSELITEGSLLWTLPLDVFAVILDSDDLNDSGTIRDKLDERLDDLVTNVV